MKKELSKPKEDVKNMTEEELQFLDSIKLEEQIGFQESTAVVASRDVKFYVKVDNNIHVHTTLKV